MTREEVCYTLEGAGQANLRAAMKAKQISSVAVALATDRATSMTAGKRIVNGESAQELWVWERIAALCGTSVAALRPYLVEYTKPTPRVHKRKRGSVRPARPRPPDAQAAVSAPAPLSGMPTFATSQTGSGHPVFIHESAESFTVVILLPVALREVTETALGLIDSRGAD